MISLQSNIELFSAKVSFTLSVLCFVLLPGLAVAQLQLQEPEDDVGPQIAGIAKMVSLSTWPATRIFSAGIGGCTATLVGARVLLTAAHCVGDGEKGKIKHRGKNIDVNKCDHHPSYDGQNSYDYALCLIAEVIVFTEFEVINTSRSYPREGHELGLLGYGCISDTKDPTRVFSQSNKSLYGGKAKVVKRPTSTNTYIKTSDEAVGCFGDSGGAAYIFFSNGRREIVGVMSRALVATNGIYVGNTYISATSNQSFIDWAEDWVIDQGVQICGITLQALNCRM